MRLMHPRAFSLIEVLISIVVLALGLLGIAAVFPAVVTQQRSTTDSVHGVSLEQSVANYLKSNRLLNRPCVTSINGLSQGAVLNEELRGWHILLGNVNWSAPVSSGNGIYDGAFETPSLTAASGLLFNAAENRIELEGTNVVPTAVDPLFNHARAWIPAQDRYLRAGAKAGDLADTYTYVWDFAARRVGAGSDEDAALPVNDPRRVRTYQDDSIQLAVFVRRRDNVTRQTPSQVPVGEDANGRPTLNATGAYAQLRKAPFTIVGFDPHTVGATDLLEIEVDRTAEPLVSYLAQYGQKFVDQWGDVHEVVKFDTPTTDIIRLTLRQPINRANAYRYGQAGLAYELVYTTHVPAAVSVVTIRPAPIPGS